MTNQEERDRLQRETHDSVIRLEQNFTNKSESDEKKFGVLFDNDQKMHDEVHGTIEHKGIKTRLTKVEWVGWTAVGLVPILLTIAGIVVALYK